MSIYTGGHKSAVIARRNATHLLGWTFEPPQNKIVAVQLLAALRGSITVPALAG